LSIAILPLLWQREAGAFLAPAAIASNTLQANLILLRDLRAFVVC
jgi:hypothetical protein